LGCRYEAVLYADIHRAKQPHLLPGAHRFLLGALQYLVLVANYWQHGAFDPQAFAIGFGALIGGIGVALGLKKDSQANT
jgi:hypothetical protein